MCGSEKTITFAFNMNILEDLNAAQRAAVTYAGGPHLVIAGAGSGKTRVLTYKIAWLISEGVPSGNILALTFTNKAAREMRERLYRLLPRESSRYLSAGTFHSVFAKILRQESRFIGYSHDFTIYDTQDSKSLLKKIVKELGLDEKIYKPSLLLARISEAKNGLMSAVDYMHSRDAQLRDNHDRIYRMSEVYNLYQTRLKAADAMDFDDLLVNMFLLLKNNPEVLLKYRDVFRYILVDEYQDTNYAQYRIIRLLSEQDDSPSESRAVGGGIANRFICVVGDDAQSIYGFRGADIRNILQFQREYEGSRIFKLEQNYRSTKNIVGAAGSLIAKNRNQIPKSIYSEREQGAPLSLRSFSGDRDEGAYIAQSISLRKREHYNLEDIAVLYRTNAQSRVIEDELRKLSLPYRIYGGLSFYQRKEIKDVLAYFRLISNPRDDESLLRIINIPSRKIGDTTMDKVQSSAREAGVPLMQVVSNPTQYNLQVNRPTAERLFLFGAMIHELEEQLETADAYTFADTVLSRTGLRTALKCSTTNEEREQWENVEELMSALQEFVSNREKDGDDAGIRAFLSEVALLTDQDEKQDDHTPRVTLMTIHAAKGLEYNVVYIAGLEENLFPSPFCESERDLEEERRLFYVAITRAKDECHLSWSKQRFRNGQQLYQTQSRFIKEISPEYLSNKPSGSYNAPVRDSAAFFSAPHRMSRVDSPALSVGSESCERTPITPPFPLGSRLRHATFGEGTLREAYNENGLDKLIVDFDKTGRKTMLQKFAKLELI